ncbi:MAG: polymer-forming cytoskeletal protein [Halapricum sp.]
MDRTDIVRGGILLIVVGVVVAGAFPGVVAAEERVGGSVVVEEGETVNGLSAFSGTVIVRGTVDGNLDGAAGSVVIEESGVVTGDVSIASGSLTIAGQVDGSVNVGAGSVRVAPTGTIGGDLNVGADSVILEGSVGGNAELGADTVRLAETASVDGDVRYAASATFTDEGATVGGSIVADSDLGTGGFDLPSFAGWLFTGYTILVNLVLGAVLLAAMPGFSRRVSETVADEPVKSGGAGLLTLVGAPIGLVLLAITIIGIPLSIAGAVMFGLLAWIALLYGRIAVAAWALHQADVDNKWLALVVGIVGFGLLDQIPILGGLLSLVTFLLGLGAIALVLVALRRERGDEGSEPAPDSAPEPGPDDPSVADV